MSRSDLRRSTREAASQPSLEAMEVIEISDSDTCDPQVWYVVGDIADEHLVAALDNQKPNWRREYSHLTFTSEQTSPGSPIVQHGHMKKAFGKHCLANAGDVGAFPVTYIRIK